MTSPTPHFDDPGGHPPAADDLHPDAPGGHPLAADVHLRGTGGPLLARLWWPAARPAPGLPPALLVLAEAAPARADAHPADGLAGALSARAGLVVLGLPRPGPAAPAGPAPSTVPAGDPATSAPAPSTVPAPDPATAPAVADAFTVLEWAADHAAELDADPGRLLVAGDGAGAGLAAAMALHARDQRWPELAHQLLVSPAPGPPGLPPPARPLAGVAPATVVTVGRPRPDLGRRYAARLRRAGVAVRELRLAGPDPAGLAEVVRQILAALPRPRGPTPPPPAPVGDR